MFQIKQEIQEIKDKRFRTYSQPIGKVWAKFQIDTNSKNEIEVSR